MEPTIRYINDWKCLHFECIDSTNLYAKNAVSESGPNNFIVIADRQTNGYGRNQKNWESSNTKGLLMSIVMPVFIDITQLAQSTLVLAVAIQRAIYQLTKLNLKIKWPNDLHSDKGKKCAGLLIENVILKNSELNPKQHILVLGIGLNVEHELTDFSQEIAKIATSLFIETGVKLDRTLLVTTILENVIFYFQQWQKQGFSEIRKDWIEHSCSIGKEIIFFNDNKQQEGTISALSPTGGLIVRLSNGETVSVDSGEILFKL